jgi:hypothetical protein
MKKHSPLLNIWAPLKPPPPPLSSRRHAIITQQVLGNKQDSYSVTTNIHKILFFQQVSIGIEKHLALLVSLTFLPSVCFFCEFPWQFEDYLLTKVSQVMAHLHNLT